MRYIIFAAILGLVVLSNFVPVNKTIMDCERDWSYYPGGFKDKNLIALMDMQPEDLLYMRHSIQKNISDTDSKNKYYIRYLFTDFVLNKNIFGKVVSINNNITNFKNFRIKKEHHRFLYFWDNKIKVLNDDKGITNYKLDIEVDKIDLSIDVNTYKDEFDPNNFVTRYKCKIVESKI